MSCRETDRRTDRQTALGWSYPASLGRPFLGHAKKRIKGRIERRECFLQSFQGGRGSERWTCRVVGRSSASFPILVFWFSGNVLGS